MTNALEIDAEQMLILRVHVSPKSSKIGWGKVQEGEIQLKINTPPVDGAANKSCIKFIAKAFKSNKSSIELLSGEKSRHKCFRISHFSQEKVDDFIKEHLAN